MTQELFNPLNKLRDQREYVVLTEDPGSKCDLIRFTIRTLNQMDDTTILNAT